MVNNENLIIEPLHKEFGARITNIDLNEPFSDQRIRTIIAAIDQYSLLCFPQPKHDR